jgi:anthranilate phosphoribosyltransferase
MLNVLIEGRNLSFEEAYETFNQILEESPVRIAATLTALQVKGFTSEELAGFAKAMKERAVRVDFGEVCDTCGTGGDYSSTINISTASAIVASCFTRVAKHGNLSVTSGSGSANVLFALGIDYDIPPERAKVLIDSTGFTFLFAPRYHPPLGKVMAIRKELGIRTIFNALGPLVNPSSPKYQLIGVYSNELVEKVAEALFMLGLKRAVVVSGSGLDEVNPFAITFVAEVTKKGVERYTITPSDFGLKGVKVVPCNSPEESAKRIVAVFSGKGSEEDRNFVLINSAMALYAAGWDDLVECRELAQEAIAKKALSKLEEIRNAAAKT